MCNEYLSSLPSAAASDLGNNSTLLEEILYSLPVKSLCAFKAVSKQWQSLISDSSFRRNYNLRSSRLSKPALFMKKKLNTLGSPKESEYKTLVMDERDDYVPFNTPIAADRYSFMRFEQSCNGLLLCRVRDNYGTAYVIYNPSMKHCKALPLPPFRNTRDYVQSVTIAFDPAKSIYYEVVGVCNVDTSKDVHHIEIYSSKTHSWKAAGNPFPLSPHDSLSVSGVYWNGSVHWIHQQKATLHYFHIASELLKAIAMPTEPYGPYPKEDKPREIVYFNECRGHIHLMERRKADNACFDIWEMLTDYTGWNVKYNVDLSPLITLYPSNNLFNRFTFFHYFKLHVLFIEEAEESSRLILWFGMKRVVSFDIKNKILKVMYDVKRDVWVEGFEYIETLAHP